MDLEELKASVEKEVNRTCELRKEQSALEDKLGQKVRENIKNFLIPVVDEFNSVLRKLYATAGSLPEDLCRVISKQKKIELDNGKIVRIDFTVSGLNVYSGLLVLGKVNELDACSNLGLSDYASLFASEDGVLSVVELIRTEIVPVFQAWADFYAEENAKLEEAIRKLSDQLASSHTMTKREDGTVEIVLGNKTYRGTLVESK